MSKKAEPSLQPFEIDSGALYIGYEDENGAITSHSYLDLKSLKYEPNVSSEFIILNFPEGRIEIGGSNLRDLFGHFEKHEISRIRRGVSLESEKPDIRTLHFRQFNVEKSG